MVTMSQKPFNASGPAMAEPEPAWQGVRVVEVSAREDGQRIDNFLMRELKGVPKSRIYRMLRNGEVRLNGGRSKPADRLSPGDRVRLPPVRTTVVAAGIVPDALIERLEASVLLEDERLLILNKPWGLAVHGGSGLSI